MSLNKSKSGKKQSDRKHSCTRTCNSASMYINKPCSTTFRNASEETSNFISSHLCKQRVRSNLSATISLGEFAATFLADSRPRSNGYVAKAAAWWYKKTYGSRHSHIEVKARVHLRQEVVQIIAQMGVINILRICTHLEGLHCIYQHIQEKGLILRSNVCFDNQLPFLLK